MNQILETNFKKFKLKSKKKKILLSLQLICSSIFMIIIFIFLINNHFSLSKKEHYSNQVLENYNIAKLYSNLNSQTDESSNFIDSDKMFNIIGIIEIPKINLYYPVFSTYDDELLKISPCKFYGSSPGKKGNLCIAGHNYDNNKFFSKISSLSNNDEIIIYDNFNKKFSYFVFDVYEVSSTDFSPIYSYEKNSSLLTLITCNNFNDNRIIVKAKLI